MAGLEFRGELPFTDVLLHGTVRDAQGATYVETLGNGIDPLRVVEMFGADAMRYTLVVAAALGTDLQLDRQIRRSRILVPGRSELCQQDLERRAVRARIPGIRRRRP